MARVCSSTQEKAFFDTQRSLVWVFLTASNGFIRKIQNYKEKILLIWGEKDRIIPFSSTDVFKTLRTDIKMELIPGAGHLPQQEKPAEIARLMTDFAGYEKKP
jgi:alpha-beta hydrolase superfamily lysophospholipase